MKAPNPLISAFYLEFESHKEYDEDHTSDDEYSRPDSFTSHDIQGIRLVANRTYDEFPDQEYNCLGAFSAVAGATVYALYAVYSTGDSFSHSANACLEPIAVFQTQSKAERAKEQLKAHEELYNLFNRRYAPKTTKEKLQNLSSRLAVPLPLLPSHKIKDQEMPFDLDKITKDLMYSTRYQDEQDQLCLLSVPWVGYFESLSHLEVFKDVLKPDRYLEPYVTPRKPRS